MNRSHKHDVTVAACNSDPCFDFEPLTDEDFRTTDAIEASFHGSSSRASLPTRKRSFTSLVDEENGSPSVSASASAARSSRPDHRRLPKSLLALQHPNPFALSPCRVDSKMRLPVMRFGGKVMYRRTTTDVEKAAVELHEIMEAQKNEMRSSVIGFDIEWRPTFRRGVPPGKVAVMQLCSDADHCYVLHVIHSGFPKTLRLLLEDPAILKVGAGIANDAGKVFKDHNVSIKGVEDLSFLANQKLGGDRHWGLSSLSENLISKQIQKPKRIRVGNWEVGELSDDQLRYAATDAFASWYLYQVIKDLPDYQKVDTDDEEDYQEVDTDDEADYQKVDTDDEVEEPQQ